jgi:hypothetical protein
MKIIPSFIISSGLTALAFNAHAQNNTSPYSVAGIGDIETSYFDRTAGMGNTGLALSSGRFLYQANPASFAWLDDHFFHFEASARFKAVNYSGVSSNTGGNSASSSDLQFKKIVAAIKVKPRWGLSAGLLPFSSVNYSFYAPKPIQGSSSTALAYYQGTGSTNLFYITNSYKVSKNFSLGLQTSYLFGQVEQQETVSTSAVDSALITQRNGALSNLHFKLGLQYKTKVSKNLVLSAGATGSLQTKLRNDYTLMVSYGPGTLVNNQLYKNNYFTLPVMYAGGLAATLKDKYTFAVDYSFQNWGNGNTSGVSYNLVNSSRTSGGFEYAKKIRYTNPSNNQILSIDRFFYQAGAFYNNGYARFSGQQINSYGFTLGAGLNSLKNSLGVMGALEVGQRGTTANGLVQEKYVQFTVTLSYRDVWFRAKKFFD